MTCIRNLALALVVLTSGGCAALQGDSGSAAPVSQKPRVVVTTDPELDESNSLVRYLLYSTDFRTEGLIYSSSGFHPDYPSPSELKSKIRIGNVEFDGDISHDSPAGRTRGRSRASRSRA